MGGTPDPRERSAATARLTPAHLVALGVVQLAVVVGLCAGLRPALGVLLTGVVSLASFVWWARFRLLGPAVRRGRDPRQRVSLVFDVPVADLGPLVAQLEQQQLSAAFVVGAARLDETRELILSLRQRGHEVLAATFDGRPTWPWSRPTTVRRQVRGALLALDAAGVATVAYVPPLGLTHPAVRSTLVEMGAFLLLPRRSLRRVRAGDVLLVERRALASTLAVLQARGLVAAPLAEVLGRPIASSPKGGVEAFYDGLADSYDVEQQSPSAPVRVAESAAVQQRLPEVIRSGARVLEVGAGTGRFTALLVALGARVTAVDVSAEMLARLEQRLGSEGAELTTLHGDFMQVDIGAGYDAICSFSCFEYVADFDRLILRLAERLAPGGVLYFTTAQRGPLRWFVQLGNAMRQGLWLRARSETEVRAALDAAGLQVVHVASHGLRLGRRWGMLLEVLARRPD